MVVKFSKIRHNELLSHKVYRMLKRSIIKGEFETGSRLLEVKIAEQMKISRTPVREAVRLLSAEGFVKILSNKHIVINQVSPQDLIDILNVRLQLEPYAIFLASKEISNKDIDNLEKIFENMEEAFIAKDTINFSNSNSNFHESILQIPKNAKLREICTALCEQSEHWIRSLVFLRRLKDSQIEHRAILDALILRDAEKAKKEMHNHLSNVIRNFESNEFARNIFKS